jgi:hypothetical protein
VGKIGLVVAIALMAGTVWIVRGVTSRLGGMCENTPVQREVSPDGVLQAVLFARDCGATTGFSSQVSILGRDEALPNRAGNAFIADLGDGAPAAPWGGPAVTLRWTGDATLVIAHDQRARVLAMEREVRGVRISYRDTGKDELGQSRQPWATE